MKQSSRRWAGLITLLLLALVLFGWLPAAPVRATSPAEVRLTRDDQTGITLTATLPPLDLAAGPAGAVASLAGWGAATRPGAPSLPEYTTLLAVPAGRQPRLRAVSGAGERVYPAVDLAPVAARRWANEPLPGERPAAPVLAEVVEPDPAIYARPGWYPAALATLGQVGALRDQAFVQLTLAGAQWDPQTRQLRSYRQLTVIIDFVPLDGDQPPAAPDRPGQSADAAAASSPITGAAAQVVDPIGVVRVSLPAPGLYALPRQNLGVPAAENWNNLAYIRFFQGDREIPRLWKDSTALFYLPPYDTRQQDAGGLIVRYTPGLTGLVPATRAVAPGVGATTAVYTASLHLEQQAVYVSHDPLGDDVDHWWWQFWFNSGNGVPPTPLQVPFTLDSAADPSRPGTLRLRLHGGFRGPGHAVAVSLNGTPLTSLSWSGRALHDVTIAVPAGRLVAGANTLTLAPPASAPGVLENGYLDFVDVGYARRFESAGQPLTLAAPGGSYAVSGLGSGPLDLWDITDPAAPQVLSGYAQDAASVRWADSAPRRYFVAAQSQRVAPAAVWSPDELDLRSPYNGADYLAITYNPPGSSSWSDALGPLVARRTAQGLRSQIIDVQWIYDQFGDGRVDPAAIRAFLAYAYANWLAPAPSYVLLVGDGTYDPHDYEGNTEVGSVPNYIPPFLAYVDPWLGETAADNRYVTLAGADDLPDIHLGRFPAASLDDVTTMVSKTIAFEQTDPQAAWTRRMLLVADDPDSAGDFHQISDDLLSILPSTVVTTTLYYSSGDDVLAFRANLSASINAGALFVNYIGHAGIDVWAEPALYTQSMISALSNGAMLPIMLPMTCYAGYYHTTFGSALAEVELRHAGGGAVASWSPTGLGIATGHDYLNRAFLNAVYNNGTRRLGPATLKGKAALAAQGLLAPDLLDTYLIFGDPALQIPLPFTPITAVADSVQIGQNTLGTPIDPRSNDIDPYHNGLTIVAVSNPLHGTVSLDRAGTTVTYTPQRRYIGPDSLTYTVVNPANGSRSSATISIDVLATGRDIFLPQIRR
jgi:hypothetical protein